MGPAGRTKSPVAITVIPTAYGYGGFGSCTAMAPHVIMRVPGTTSIGLHYVIKFACQLKARALRGDARQLRSAFLTR